MYGRKILFMFSFFSDGKILSDFTGMFVVWLFSVGEKTSDCLSHRFDDGFHVFYFSPEMALSTDFVLLRLMAT